MSDLDLREIKEIQVVDAKLGRVYTRETKEATARVNQLLSEGWQLLKIGRSSSPVVLDPANDVDGIESDCHYILGR